MKVETGIKAGNLVTSASQGANKLVTDVQDFVGDASYAAEDLTRNVTQTASSFWNWMRSGLNL